MKRKSNLDEAQEQTLLKIEHNGCWLAFWGLLIAIVVQSLLWGYQAPIWGEVAVLLAVSLYMLVDCLRNGIWDRKVKADLKTAVGGSAVAGAIVGVLQFVMAYRNWQALVGSLAAAAFAFLLTFGLTLGVMLLSIRIYKNRREKLDEDEETK